LALIIGLTAKKEYLKERINKSVISRIDQGMIEEVESLLQNDLSEERLLSLGLEYRVITDYLLSRIENKEGLIDKLQTKTGQFAKRQLTWFKKQKDIHWFDISNRDYITEVEKFVLDWYNLPNE
jgi:tRNA dimethylallyltransferase